ncbi:MAG: hypothetical protein FWG03_03135 [Clostridiales bacterium]|nr:hypothetical protein [Clostridiales bacterium]
MPLNEMSTIKEISENEQARAVMEKYIPGVWELPIVRTVMSFKLKRVAEIPGSGISQEMLESILKDFSAIGEDQG